MGQKYAIKWLFLNNCLYLYQQIIDQSLVQNVDRLCFVPNAPLRIEFEELYTALFKHAYQYISVVKALSLHKEGMTRNDMIKVLKIEGRNLTAVLRNLERCDFIAKMARFPNKSTDAIYRLVDFYTLFYYKFLAEDMSGDEQWWSHNFQSHSVDLGIIVLLHISQ